MDAFCSSIWNNGSIPNGFNCNATDRGDTLIWLIMAAFFMLLALLELKVNVVNSFVLFTISVVYLRGYTQGNGFIFTASLIAVIFALISLLTLLASIFDSLILNEPNYKLDYSLAGLIALPLLRRRWNEYKEDTGR